ncbi:MAG: hypothetical protein QM813_13480 [Verrucomicrobiota bacterium]
MSPKHLTYSIVSRFLIVSLVLVGLSWRVQAQSVFEARLSTLEGRAQLSLGRIYFRVEGNQMDFLAVLTPVGRLMGDLNPVLNIPGDSLDFDLGLASSQWLHGSYTVADHNPFLPAPEWRPHGSDEDGNPIYIDTTVIRRADIYTGQFTLPEGFLADLLAGSGDICFNLGFGGEITVVAVPEPTVGALLLVSGLGAYGGHRLRRRNGSTQKATSAANV